MWELACLRCRRRGVSDVRRWCNRRQASSHIWSRFGSGFWGVGQLCL